MNSISKLIIATTAIVLLQSCNMAKHYANMRIDHDYEIIALQKQVAQPKSIIAYSDESNVTQNAVSICDSGSIEVSTQPEIKSTQDAKEKPKTIQNHVIKHPFIKRNTCSGKTTRRQGNKKPGFFKIKKISVSSAKYIDVDEEKTKILLCLAAAGILALLVSLGVFGPVGSVILIILAGLGVAIAAGFAFCLLIMVFLAMLGMNLFY